MEAINSESVGQWNKGGGSWLSRHKGLAIFSGVVVLVVVVVVAEYFIVHAIDENNDDSSSATTTETSSEVDIYSFPDDFIIASATAAFQVEGAWNISGKGESIWDYYCHTYPSRCSNTNGNDACESYYLYKRDVQMLVETGFDGYRFSISWPRVLPNGTTDYINDDGIQYYHNVLDELLAYNITPLVTLYHWDLPQKLQADYNGWLNDSISDLFADYAALMFQEYGDKVKYWITFNEPNMVTDGYSGTQRAPGYEGTSGVDDYIANHNIIKAHGKAYQVYNTTYRAAQNGSLGMTYSMGGCIALNASDPEDLEASFRAYEFSIGLYASAIYSSGGNYPSIVRERIDNNSIAEGKNYSRLPHFTDIELEYIRGSYDFIGVNHYGSQYVTTSDTGESGTTNSGSTSSGEGLRHVLNWLRVRYDGVPLFVTENGYRSSSGLNDTGRIELYHSMIKGVLEAKYIDGCNIIGYTAWSLMDNMEWESGYTPKYGIYQVDFNDVNRTRTMKDSALWFQTLLSNRRLPNVTDY